MVGIQPDTSPSDSPTEQHILLLVPFEMFQKILTMAGDLFGDLHMNKLGFVQNRTVSCEYIYIYIFIYAQNYVIT